MEEKEKIILGLNVPLFCASLFVLFVGAPLIGLYGIWGFIIPKIPFPQHLKVLHAHLSWWSIVILVASLIAPPLSLKKWFKKIIIFISFVLPILYPLFINLHYQTQNPYVLDLGKFGVYYLTIFGFLGFLIEILFFGLMFILLFIASDLKIPIFTQQEISKDKYELLSEITISKKTIFVSTIFLLLSVITGIYILSQFVLQHRAISPAALVQLHTHIGFFAIGMLMIVITLSVVGANERIINLAHNLGIVSLSMTFLGLLAFIYLKLPSIVWVIPSMLYYILLIIGLLSLLGKFGLREFSGPQNYIRIALIVIWSALLIFVLAGPYLALRYDTSPDLTVTYKQKDGGLEGKHIGPYPSPEEWQGTAPVVRTPRGIENFHLSPGSWSHVAIFWLIVLFLFGEKMLSQIRIPNFIFFLATTIPLAPILNAMGRIGAWLGPAVGGGALYLGGHPLKVINIISLFIVSVLWLMQMKKE